MRFVELVFAVTAYVTVPAPEPEPPEDTVSHDTVLAAVHEQPFGALTPTVPLSAVAATVALIGESAYVHAMPACVTVNASPAIVNEPERDEVDLFAATAYVTCPFDVPFAPPVIVIQEALLDAVHAQPEAVVTTTDPVAASASTDVLTGLIV